MQENRMFSRMLLAARERLKGRDAEEIAKNAGAAFDGASSCFRLKSLGEEIAVRYPEYSVEPKLAGWHQLLILHYLDLADGTALANRPVSFSQLRDGMVRGGGFDRRCEQAVEALMKEISEEELELRCRRMGGRRIESNADYEAELPFLPNYPIRLKLWFADEDFPASGRMLPDASADHYLTIEDAVTVGEIILERLAAQK